MPNERIYNIALDKFMEEKVRLMLNIKKFPKELYYNQKDKEYLLYKLDPTLAKQVWEKLKDYICNKKVAWLSTATCPFCIEAEIKYGIRDRQMCEICAYKKNHRDINCMSQKSDLYKISSVRVFNIKNSKYVNVIEKISKELFESNNIKDKNEKIYNIALDKFMEEVCIQLKNYLDPKFRKELYYNNKDKEFILYQLSPDEAQRIWETFVNNIHTHKRMEGFAKSILPFCIKFKNCDECVYKKNHINFEDIEYILHLIRVNSISDTRFFSNEWYRETIKRISEELFDNINNYPKKFTVDYDNFRIIVKQNYKNNKIDKFPCDALYSWYDFTHQRVGDEIISANDIEDINNREFENVDPKTVKMVFEFAEKCEVSNNGGVLYNFIVYPNGEIKINYDMKRIKDFLEEIKKEYDKYLKNRCNIVKVEIKD